MGCSQCNNPVVPGTCHICPLTGGNGYLAVIPAPGAPYVPYSSFTGPPTLEWLLSHGWTNYVPPRKSLFPWRNRT
jgi:hypothetical protein